MLDPNYSLFMARKRIIGFLGHFPSSMRYGSYRSCIEGIINQHLRRGGEYVVTGIGSSFECECARHVLQLRGASKRVRLRLVVTGRQRAAYERARASGSPLNPAHALLEFADEVVTVGEADTFTSVTERRRIDYFVESADKLYYFAGPAHSLLTQYFLFSIEQHPQTEAENLYFPRPATYENIDAASRNYLFSSGFFVYSTEAPDSILAMWTLPCSFDYAPYFEDAQSSAAELIDDVSDRPQLLPLKIFFLTYSLLLLRHDRTRGWERSREDFETFQRLVRMIRERRRTGREVPDFDLFDYRRYPKILKRLA